MLSLRQPPRTAAAAPEVVMSLATLDSFMRRIRLVHDNGLKSFGLLASDPTDPAFPYVVSNVVFPDPARNRRNE